MRDAKFGSTLIAEVALHGLGPFLDSTRMLVALIDADAQILAANPAFERLVSGAGPVPTVVDLITPEQRERASRLLDIAKRDQTPERGHFDFGLGVSSAGYNCLFVPADQGTILLFGEPIMADADLVSANEGLAVELDAARTQLADKTAELRAVVAQADEMVHTDSLTSLPNRHSIISSLRRHVTYAERYGTTLAVSMLDLDGFKAVNDDSGHPSGDFILSIVARALRDRIRQPDEIGRYGGDEFLVILPNSTAGAASDQASRLCQHLRSTSMPLGEKTIRLTLSAGIAQFAPATDTWESLLDRADRALLEAKRLGGDQWLILET